MSVRHQADAKTLGKRFAELVRQRDLPVQSVWVRYCSGYPEVWVIITPMELKEERPIHKALVDLHNEFPDSVFEDRVVNPSWLPNRNVEREVPRDATRVFDRT